MSGRRAVLIVAALPPPVTGAAEINRAVADLAASRLPCILINHAPRRLGTGWRVRAARSGPLIWALARVCWLLATRQADTVYLSAAGSAAMVYDALLLGLARSLGARLIIHHHATHYLRERTRLSGLPFAAAGQKALHVVLCPDMGTLLSTTYPAAGRVLAVSNAAVFAPPTRSQARTPPSGRPLRIGSLANISVAKGSMTMLCLRERLRAAGVPCEVWLAGGWLEPELKPVMDAAMAADPGLRVIGPVYGADKAAYLEAVDLLVLPSHSEAEPLVVFEALAAGLPMIAWRTGCIGRQLAERPEWLIDPQGPDPVAAALTTITALGDAATYSAASTQALGMWQRLRGGAAAQAEHLLDELGGAT